jgi:uncharacterized LabA/DUF88 family protein
LSEERLKIAVFIDFDNIEIGVKKTLSRHFDIGAVLEAIKERGEVVTKVAYGDWKHAADYSRALTQHAVHMVQRNLTPGGDKNGADITLALDALEMAFTRSHINAFVIVGGDSDFIALVEKLKQYDKTVFIVGGRSFTSSILQKNCHEFIAYENLIGIQPVARKTTGRTHTASTSSTAQLRDALPPLRRALQVLADREVSPQLGLLKSTLLQLDSTFSERDYGVHSFREFIQKMANAGYVNLKQVDRSLLVELKDVEGTPAPAVAAPHAPAHSRHAQAEAPVISRHVEEEAPLISRPVDEEAPAVQRHAEAEASVEPHGVEAEAPASLLETTVQPPNTAAGIEAVRSILGQAGPKTHWPMYLRSFKHFLRASDPSFDERRFGYSSIHDLARQAQREGLLRIERNRQGILRIFLGDQSSAAAPEHAPVEETTPPEEIVVPETVASSTLEAPPFPMPQTEAVAETFIESSGAKPPREVEPIAADEKPKRRRAAGRPESARGKKPATKRPRAAKKTAEVQ